MTTVRFGPRICSVGASPHGLRLAARAIAQGAVVAYPTEAVYGLGCDPLDADAVRRILTLKGRSERQGLILIAADFAALEPFVVPVDTVRMAAIEASWPGPSTWLLPARAGTPGWLTGRHDTLAVRVPGHAIARDLCRAWGGALVSTSANRSAAPPARSALQVRRRLGRGLDMIVTGPCGGASRPSRIRDGRTGRVLRD
ncbi:MAG: Sua5/YciO/YrdC/YwlC family protein [Thiohalocapsa sp.]